jgi:hypothetical protein
MTTESGNCQTKDKKIISITLHYYDLVKVQELQRTLPYPMYIEEIEKQAHKVFDIDATYWELILNVIATAKEIECDSEDMLKPVKSDCTLIIKYDDESVDKFSVWRIGFGAISDWYCEIDSKYSATFLKMLNSYIVKDE